MFEERWKRNNISKITCNSSSSSVPFMQVQFPSFSSSSLTLFLWAQKSDNNTERDWCRFHSPKPQLMAVKRIITVIKIFLDCCFSWETPWGSRCIPSSRGCTTAQAATGTNFSPRIQIFCSKICCLFSDRHVFSHFSCIVLEGKFIKKTKNTRKQNTAVSNLKISKHYSQTDTVQYYSEMCRVIPGIKLTTELAFLVLQS